MSERVEHFKRVQRLWAIWGAVIWIGAIAVFGFFFGGRRFKSEVQQCGIDGMAE
jgi:hypothetical protein